MLKTAMIFGNGMVLQRRKEIPVWGIAEPGKRIFVTLGGVTEETTVNENGEWLLRLPPQEAGRGLRMVVRKEEEVLDFTDVCVGEVWLAGGQSNMEYPLGSDVNGDIVIEADRNPDLRFFDYPEVAYEGQLEDYRYDQFGFWRKCNQRDLPCFSAIGYYFGRNLSESLEIPIGIIGCNWGGTTACSWMDPELLRDNEGRVWLEDYEQAIKNLDLELYFRVYKSNPINDRTKFITDKKFLQNLKYGSSFEEQEQMMKFLREVEEKALPLIGPYWERRPGGLYETMLKKLVPYGIRGFIWYQGESDDEHPEAYTAVFGRLIENWRNLWMEKLPFLLVQLAPFGDWMTCSGEKYPIIRECQEEISKEMDDVWMASIGDCGMEHDIHPKNKQPVGERLALLARGHVYGESVLCDAPELESVCQNEEEITLQFRYAQGLYLDGKKINGLELWDEDGGKLDVNRVLVREDQLILYSSPNVKKISFAQTGYYEINLYNAAHIPVKPFKVVFGEEGKVLV